MGGGAGEEAGSGEWGAEVEAEPSEPERWGGGAHERRLGIRSNMIRIKIRIAIAITITVGGNQSIVRTDGLGFAVC